MNVSENEMFWSRDYTDFTVSKIRYRIPSAKNHWWIESSGGVFANPSCFGVKDYLKTWKNIVEFVVVGGALRRVVF
jgi:hypothetical protein